MVVTLKIDSAGRIVVPKPIRDQLGLYAGAHIEVVNGLWVHRGRTPAQFDWSRFAQEEREEQSRRILGL